MDGSVFERPRVSGPIGSVGQRQRVVVSGLVVEAGCVGWVGGPVLEVRLRDLSGEITLAFLGRRALGGVRPGSVITAAGTVGHHHGLTTILNPQIWLEGAGTAGARSVDISAHA